MILIAALVGEAVLWKQASAAFAAVHVWVVCAITVRDANETPITFTACEGNVIVVAAAIVGRIALSKTVTIVLWILNAARQRRNRGAVDSNGTTAYCLCKPAAISANCQRHILKACLALNKAVF